MTLTAEQSSNKAEYEAAPTAAIIDIVRTAMGEGCIRPCHVYDAVDELICRIQALENRPKRNCDVGTSEDQGERFKHFCRNHQFISVDSEDGFPLVLVCSNKSCPLHGYYIAHGEDNCELAWAQMPYEGDKK